MTFILKMAWRDSRASRRRLALFSLSIVLGIAALVALGSFGANLESAIQDQTKALLGADLTITARQPVKPELQAHMDSLTGEQSREVSFSSMLVTLDGRTRLVQVRALDGPFPFYGEFVTHPASAAQAVKTEDQVAVLEPTLLAQFGLKEGDKVKLGTLEFRIVGSVENIPGDSLAVAQLAPRVFIPLRNLAATGLAGEGSLVRYRTALKLPETVNPVEVEKAMREKFRAERLSYDTVEERKRELGQVMRNVTAFLSLVGFIALVLGAIGVASAVHVYIRQKIPTVAVLRCLGASARQSFSIYLVQSLGLGLFGALLGAAIGIAIQLILPAFAKDWLPFEVDFFISWAAVVRGVLAGLIICVLFALLPLLAIRRVSPLVALRSAFAAGGRRFDPWTAVVVLAIVGAVTAFAIVQARSLLIGLGFTGMLVVAFVVFTALARAVAWVARRWLPKGLPYVVRQGVANLHRPNNRTVLLLVSLGLGTFLVLTLYLTRATLLGQIQGTGGDQRPNLMFFDIQDDQIDPLKAVMAEQGAPAEQSAPIVTMRVVSLKGRTIEELLRDPAENIPAWTLRREYRSTFRDHLVATEMISDGEFIGKADGLGGVIPISVEDGLARDMRVTVGDEMEFDVQGVRMKTKITSLRTVDWQRMQPNFFVVFPAGVLEDAPKFYVVATRAKNPEESARVQQAVVKDFPSVSSIDLGLVLKTLDDIFDKVSFVVQFMAFFTVATGVIVLAGAIFTGKQQRIRETVLLRTVGATGSQLMRIQLVEYAILGLLAAIVGAGLAVVGNVLLAQFVFKTASVNPAGTLGGAVVAVVVVTLVTGLLTNRGLTRHPPLEILRQET